MIKDATVNIYKIFQFSTLTGSACRRKVKAQPTRSSPRKLGRKKAQATTPKPQKQPTPETFPEPEPRSPTPPGPDVEAGRDAVAKAAGGVLQAGGGERSADLYIRHTIRESCVNCARLLRYLSAIHS